MSTSWQDRFEIGPAFWGKHTDLTGQMPGCQFIGQVLGIVDFFEGFDNRAGMHGQRPALHVVIHVIPNQRFQIAVEDDAHQFGLAIEDRAARVAADDVVGADKIKGRFQIQFPFLFQPALGQVERGLVVVLVGSLVSAGDDRPGRDVLAGLFVTFNGSK